MTHKTKIIFVLATLYLIAAGAVFTFFTLEVDRVGSLLESRISLVANQYAQEVQFAELNDLIDSTKAEREELSQYILTESDTITFLADIENIGEQQGVSLNTNSLDATKNQNGPDKLTVTFSIGGEEALVNNMLSILETLPYESEVNSLTYNLSEDGNVSLRLTLNLTML